jgi:hypothetical protein
MQIRSLALALLLSFTTTCAVDAASRKPAPRSAAHQKVRKPRKVKRAKAPKIKLRKNKRVKHASR